MFTPIGAGGHGPTRRHRARRLLVLLLVLALLAAVAWGGYWWFFGGGHDDVRAAPTATPSPSCRTPRATLPDRLPPRRNVEVEVLNGTDQSGLATQTADDLVVVGFDVVSYGNADQPVRSVARVTYGKGDLGAAVVAAAYFPGATLKRVDRNTGGVVTVTLGAEFDRVATPREARDNLGSVALPTPSPVCG
jgi:hypothetical protein